MIGEANRGLALYDAVLREIPNPAALLSVLTTQEAVLSSRIEGTQADLRDVLEYQADPGRPRDPALRADAHEILNYKRAMERAVGEQKNALYA